MMNEQKIAIQNFQTNSHPGCDAPQNLPKGPLLKAIRWAKMGC